jgi:hypothetical protein
MALNNEERPSNIVNFPKKQESLYERFKKLAMSYLAGQANKANQVGAAGVMFQETPPSDATTLPESNIITFPQKPQSPA